MQDRLTTLFVLLAKPLFRLFSTSAGHRIRSPKLSPIDPLDAKKEREKREKIKSRFIAPAIPGFLGELTTQNLSALCDGYLGVARRLSMKPYPRCSSHL